jgi:hypothetical protein
MEARQTYNAFLFKQREESPLQVAFVASSSEIDSWARVPTKKTGNVRNFQRAELPRHTREVEQFFTNLANTSPTAIVLGFDPIRAKGRVRLLDSKKSLLDVEAIRVGEPTAGFIEIAWTTESDPDGRVALIEVIASVASTIRGFVFSELTQITGLQNQVLDEVASYLVDRARSGQLPELSDDSESGLTEESEESEGVASDFGADVEEMPGELVGRMPGLSPAEHQIVLGRLTFLAQLDSQVLERTTTDDLKTLYREVREELKPGLIIDGQHRVIGTKRLAAVPFLVTALPLADWPELAFQFIVTNRTARRVPESLLISIVGNSLSKDQRAAIEARLRDANIRVGLIEAVMQVHEDESSPFFGLLAFGLKGEKGFLDAAAMRGKVILLWYERQGPVLDLFDHFCEGKKKSERTDYWKEQELWFKWFVAFWSAVRERYGNTAVFSAEVYETGKDVGKPVSRLMTATVLKIFQETILGRMLKQFKGEEQMRQIPVSKSIPDEGTFSKFVNNLLTRLTPEFFEGWALTGFDGSRGAREDLADAINKVIAGERSVAQLKKEQHRLFKAPTR